MSRWKPKRHQYNPREFPRVGLGLLPFPQYSLMVKDTDGDITVWKLRNSCGPGLILAPSDEGLEAAAEVVADYFPEFLGKPVVGVKIFDLDDLLAIRDGLSAKLHTKGFYYNVHNPGGRFDFGLWDTLKGGESQ